MLRRSLLDPLCAASILVYDDVDRMISLIISLYLYLFVIDQ
jgi:hypothetical protein